MKNEEIQYGSFWKQMAQVNTSIPARVVNIRNNLETMTVDVQPLINNYFYDETDTVWATLYNVPVIFPASATSAFTFPINKDDTVLIVFSQRDIETFQNGEGKPLPPNTHAKFDQNDAIAIAGLFTKKKSINSKINRTLTHDTKDAVLSHNIGSANEVEIRFKPDGTLRIFSPTKVYVESPEIEAVTETLNVTVSSSTTIDSPTTEWTGDMTFTGNITLAGNLTQTGTHLLDGINMNTHTHMVLETNSTTVPHPTMGPQ